MNEKKYKIADRFRGYLPVIIDVETGGLNHKTDALLEVAAVLVDVDENGKLFRTDTHAKHILPFDGARLDPKSLEFNKIDPYHPFRMAVSEKEGITEIFKPIRTAVKAQGCQRAILVGHNAWFDLFFMNEAVKRAAIKRNPFHPFSSFDTATMCGLVFGQTVLAVALKAAKIEFDAEKAHSAIYDAEKTADLFCEMVNRTPFEWPEHTSE